MLDERTLRSNFDHFSWIRGHSINTWTRVLRGRGGGQKMSVFFHAQGIKTVHAGEGGGSKNGKILST